MRLAGAVAPCADDAEEHSDGITDWQGSRDGMVGILGPLGSDARIATTGARVSHDCIRLRAWVNSRPTVGGMRPVRAA